MSDHRIASLDDLARAYPNPIAPASTFKEIDHVDANYAALIAASPFFVLATVGPEGLDCSPRGDLPGFVTVRDAKTLLIPDRKGNNRLDSLKNILFDDRIGMLFLVPGCGETLRVNGRAAISCDPQFVFAIRDGREAASERHGRPCRGRLLPVLPRGSAGGALEPGAAGRPAQPALARDDVARHHGAQRRGRDLRRQGL